MDMSRVFVPGPVETRAFPRARELRQADFVAEILGMLETTGANPERLCLELTESALIEDFAATLPKLHAIRALGVSFAVDDFGTGFSSLSYLTRLPLDRLKIDRSFVERLPASPSDAVVTQTIISMASSLGLAVVAEGVETRAQRDFLHANGCDAYQGYLFSRPLPPADFDRFLTGR